LLLYSAGIVTILPDILDIVEENKDVHYEPVVHDDNEGMRMMNTMMRKKWNLTIMRIATVRNRNASTRSWMNNTGSYCNETTFGHNSPESTAPPQNSCIQLLRKPP
jgi:hypothetical protein